MTDDDVIGPAQRQARKGAYLLLHFVLFCFALLTVACNAGHMNESVLNRGGVERRGEEREEVKNDR
jgi:hypothetical protein